MADLRQTLMDIGWDAGLIDLFFTSKSEAEFSYNVSDQLPETFVISDDIIEEFTLPSGCRTLVIS